MLTTTESSAAGVSAAAVNGTSSVQRHVDGGFDAVLDEFRVGHLEKYRQPQTVVLMVGYAAVFLLSLAGNLLVLVVVLSNRAMRTTTNYFLVNLSVADLLGTRRRSALV